jgi:uncharacterized protein YaiL (DUF2058 family)
MNDSLKDQLIALGLAQDKPRKRRPGTTSRGRGRGQKGNGPATAKAAGRKARGAPADGISLEQAWRERQREEKRTREAAREAKLAEERRRRRLNQEIGELVEGKALNDAAAELKRNFVYKGKIRSVRVTAEQLEALNEGRLALVFLRGSYLVVEPGLAEAVRKLSAEHVPNLSGPSAEDEDGDHPVPDDLIW